MHRTGNRHRWLLLSRGNKESEWNVQYDKHTTCFWNMQTGTFWDNLWTVVFFCVLLKILFRTLVLFLGHWYPCFGLLVSNTCVLHCPYYGILRFTSGATPADILAASIVAEPFQSMYLQTNIDRAWVCYLSYHCFTAWYKTYALPTELCWLGVFFASSSPI